MVRYKAIPNFPGYRIGIDGSVWTRFVLLRPRSPRVEGKIWRMMKRTTNKSGRLVVGLYRNGKNNSRYVHRLVLEAFVGPCPLDMECRHFPDRNPANCCLSNLSWDTKQQNMADKIMHGTDMRGSKHHKSILTEKDILKIRLLLQRGKPQKEIAKLNHVSQQTISAIATGVIWKHVV
jgi:hypothetical protein